MSYRIIQNILDDKLALVPDVPTIVKENIDKSNCVGSYYVRATFMPAKTDTVSATETGFDRFKGLYQIDVMYPTNEGTDASNYMADQIIAEFSKKDILSANGISVRIVQHWRETATEYDTILKTPVMIQWETYILRS